MNRYCSQVYLRCLLIKENNSSQIKARTHQQSKTSYSTERKSCVYLPWKKIIAINEPCHEKNLHYAYAKTKAQISFPVTAKLISALVFAIEIVMFLYFPNPNFPASSHLLCLYSSVCVEPVRSPDVGFLMPRLKFCIQSPV